MNIEILKKIIVNQRNDLEIMFEKEKIVERTHKNYVEQFLKHPNIIAILGVRRSGKSTFSFMLSKQLKEKIGYLNFDDERLLEFKTNDFEKVLQAFYELYGDVKTIILDELQNVKGWELFVNRLRRTKKVIITGSNSNLLSGELSTHLTGRYVDFTLYPFSFKELVKLPNNTYLTENIAKIRNELKNYVEESGFPEFKKFGSKIIIKIYEDIINKDCLRRYNIKNQQTFRELAKYLITNFSQEFTYSKLSKIFGIKDVHTTKNYVNYLCEAFLFIVINQFSTKLKQHSIAPKKIYSIDHSFGNFIGFKLSDNKGFFYENIVCVELFRKQSVNSAMEVYYWKNIKKEEVDFVIKQKNKIKQLIQVCYDISNPNTKKREITSLLKASEELKCTDLLIISSDFEDEEKIEGKTIKYVPLWKWLLN
ncbi:hypothetical protein COV11_04795 [Candidatus Woesearchaeota archaeon CG10_big_fil_rev_8_21_14_0_10_30_7]|nr:MAG: hypothetical protein COV11_04795 [Candidatus Woesearchaeota archaeon CG10_big_fil_rev_8_21_14_0_10_30_7]